jgi:hypothetical protein
MLKRELQSSSSDPEEFRRLCNAARLTSRLRLRLLLWPRYSTSQSPVPPTPTQVDTGYIPDIGRTWRNWQGLRIARFSSSNVKQLHILKQFPFAPRSDFEPDYFRWIVLVLCGKNNVEIQNGFEFSLDSVQAQHKRHFSRATVTASDLSLTM